MKKYQSVKLIDLTDKPKHLQSFQESMHLSKFNSCTRSAKRSQSKQHCDFQCLTERMNTKCRINDFQPNYQPKANIKTYVRFKPITNNELLQEDDFAVIEQLDIPNPTTVIFDENTHFTYDRVFEPESIQKNVYEQCAKELVDSFISGYNTTIFAYGQTGSGKTFTMFGEGEKKGIIPQSIEQIFSEIEGMKESVELSCSMLEIYRQNMIDLLTEDVKELKIKETSSGIQVFGLSQHDIQNKEETMKLINKGAEMRKIRGTDVNQRSSRSHLIFTIELQVKKSQFEVKKSKINMVDLAGSQKVSKTKVSGEGLEQAKKINLSLSCLGNTINALSKGQDHIPFRDSKLTRVLQESLSGNSMTRVIVTCSMHSSCQEQTYSSLKFAHRVKKLKTGPVQNIHQLRSSEQSVNRMMYQTLKSSFRNYEQKIQQIKELLYSEGVCLTTKEQLIEMMLMIVNGQEPLNTEVLETDRQRKCEEELEKKLRTSKRNKENSLFTQGNLDYIKELQGKIKDLQKIIIKQESLIKSQEKELQKNQGVLKPSTQINIAKPKQQKVKIRRVSKDLRKPENSENGKISEVLTLVNRMKNEKNSYEKMQKQIFCRQIQDLMNRICSKESAETHYYEKWKQNVELNKKQYNKLEKSFLKMLEEVQGVLGQMEGKTEESFRSPYTLHRVSSNQKF